MIGVSRDTNIIELGLNKSLSTGGAIIGRLVERLTLAFQ